MISSCFKRITPGVLRVTLQLWQPQNFSVLWLWIHSASVGTKHKVTKESS